VAGEYSGLFILCLGVVEKLYWIRAGKYFVGFVRDQFCHSCSFEIKWNQGREDIPVHKSVMFMENIGEILIF